MRYPFTKAISTATASLFLLAATLPTQASEVLNPPIQVAAKKKSKKSGSSRAKFDSGSGETKKERSARLSRECKGQVNAGACAGYTR